MSLQNNSNAISVSLPQTLGVSNLASLIEALSRIGKGAGDVELDCANVSFVDPLGMTVLAAALESLDKQRRVSMPWLSTKIAGYMERMDFFNGIPIEGVNIPQNRVRHDQHSNLLEITRLVTQIDQKRLPISWPPPSWGKLLDGVPSRSTLMCQTPNTTNTTGHCVMPCRN